MVPASMPCWHLSVKVQPALSLENVHCDLHVSPGRSCGENVPLRGKARSLGSTVGSSHENSVDLFTVLTTLVVIELVQGLGNHKEGLSREGHCHISVMFQVVPNDVERIPTLREIGILIGTCKSHE